MKYRKRIFEKPRNGETKSLITAAREAMKEFKSAKGIRVIVPKTKNQRVELKRYQRSKRIEDAHEARKISCGAASGVRILKPEDLKDA